ncbi:MAG: hypothetical protein HC835_11615 [Oscillatoriales cyanobacterium RM2_1_1]|nr:hypothetical protein [Oscillatoriales cyanobacterium SM2_3_0]NJO46220.1 hypothetical protein [Oscillatoriales cyanobacterium RM2_1_1]
MLSWPIDPGIYGLLLFLHCLIGSVAALIAKRRGYDYRLWLFLGLLGGTAAFVVSLILKPRAVSAQD